MKIRKSSIWSKCITQLDQWIRSVALSLFNAKIRPDTQNIWIRIEKRSCRKEDVVMLIQHVFLFEPIFDPARKMKRKKCIRRFHVILQEKMWSVRSTPKRSGTTTRWSGKEEGGGGSRNGCVSWVVQVFLGSVTVKICALDDVLLKSALWIVWMSGATLLGLPPAALVRQNETNLRDLKRVQYCGP